MALPNPRPPLRIVDGPTAEAALVRAAVEGDGSASEQLYLTCAPDLGRWVARVVLGSADAQDIVQDTFVVAFTQLKKLKRPEAFRGWLRTIALTHIRRRFRTQRLLRRLGFATAEPFELESILSEDAPPEVITEVRQVAALLRQLPADEALALVLRRVEGYRLEEIAEELKLSLATVKRRLAAAESHFQALQEVQS
ncbi:MAG: sigma-70 family RNA polymerase sigma factor [Archangium sp.]|nr:sigma-70 family RNA polymerase sigma factor [Archangium sp.]